MNAEEIKLISDLLTTLGATGKEAFIWWLVVKYLLQYVAVLAGIGIAGFVAIRIVAAFNGESKLVEIRNLLRIGSGSWYSREEHTQVMRKIAELNQK